MKEGIMKLPLTNGTYTRLQEDYSMLQQQMADIEQVLYRYARNGQQECSDQVSHSIEQVLQTNRSLLTEIVRKHNPAATPCQSSDLLQRFFATSHIAVAYLDTAFTFIWVNRAYALIYDHEPDFFPGKSSFACFPDDDLQVCLQQVLATGEDATIAAYPLKSNNTADCDVTYWDWSAHPVQDATGALEGIILCMVNVTERVQADAIYRTLVEHTPQGLAILQDGRFVFVNQAMTSINGYTPEEMLAMAPEDIVTLIHPEDCSLVQEYFEDRLAGKPRPQRYEYRIMHSDGVTRWIEVTTTVFTYQGRPALQATYTDVTERKATVEQLRQQVLHDDLTGLPNRTLFMELLEHAIKRTRRNSDYRFAVLFLDLNNFKVVNDSLGHIAGDEMLNIIGGRLKARVRASDTVARFGGDEFVILLEDFSSDLEVIVLTHRLQRDVSMPVYLNEHEVLTSASIGIALGSSDYHHPSDVLRDADTAMFSARALGPGRYAVFDATMHTQVMRRLDTEGALRRAIEHEELCLYYQPVVSLATGQITGFEALVRWQHPRRGILAPGEFIPIAEETGLILPLNWWVIRQACQQVGKWQQRFPHRPSFTVAINLSAQAFAHNNLVDQIVQALQESNLQASSLKIEITENMMMDNAESTIKTLKRLCDLGVQLCIDDFGTGFSSLRYLHRFPLHILKIDRSFVRNLSVDTESAAIIQSIVTLSHTLGKAVIAEGVETVEQLRYLQSLNCEYGQGYLFSRPVDSSMAEKVLKMGSYSITEMIGAYETAVRG
jgi:diguanylate cyclase (GGDEF)-like protein/PAS domain S-box-containing protein